MTIRPSTFSKDRRLLEKAKMEPLLGSSPRRLVTAWWRPLKPQRMSQVRLPRREDCCKLFLVETVETAAHVAGLHSDEDFQTAGDAQHGDEE